VLTPVSPHMLFDRSLVLADSEELGFVVRDDQGVVLTLDGRELGKLGEGDQVSCVAAAEPLQLASLRARDFHQVLKAKFALPDR
jgi:NAD+ kinase